METKAFHPAMEAVDHAHGSRVAFMSMRSEPDSPKSPGGPCDCKAKVARERPGTFSFAAMTVVRVEFARCRWILVA